MTPAARLAAAIEVLDKVLAGEAAEKTLTNWGRTNRYAGSGDRSAVRDHVFDVLRCRRSFAHLGAGMTGRALIIGMLRSRGDDPAACFTGLGHAPAALTAADLPAAALPDQNTALDCPDWLSVPLKQSLGADFAAVMTLLQSRAAPFLRVNLAQGTMATAIDRLAQEGIFTTAHPLSATALEVTQGARRIARSDCYLTGLVELQDAASQAVVDVLPLRDGLRVLDYCAGGGGKSLAMVAKAAVRCFVHDADPRRLADIPARAARAKAVLTTLLTADLPEHAPFDLVLTDVPCSGSGSWRRAPEAKWSLTPARLSDLCNVQARVLDQAAGLTAPDGVLAYATCSLLDCENGDQITGFLHRSPGWSVVTQRQFTPLDGGDGFFVATLRRMK